MEVLGSVEAEVDHGFVSALAGGVVVDLHLARRLAEKLEVDLVMRVAVEAGARVGEEAGDDAGRGDGLQACLDAAIAEEAARLVFRSEARRVGKEWVNTCRSRWEQMHIKKKTGKN